MALTKLDKNLLGFSDDTDFVKLPSGTTAQRPGSPAAGQFRFNTTLSDIEVYDGTAWVRMGITPPAYSSVDYPGDDTALDPAGGQSLIINGDTFNTGITLTIDGTTPSSITRNSSTQLTVTTPAKSAGTYAIVFTNTDGGTATATNVVSYNGIPTFTYAAGSLGSAQEGTSVSLSAVATEPDGGAIGYTITSGALPSGVSINASTGAITGTAPTVSADTIYSFTVTATDNENQSVDRAYTITITPKVPSDSFNIVTYSGNGTADRAITVGFQPDYIVIKRTSGADNWRALDTTRGLGFANYWNLSNSQDGSASPVYLTVSSTGFATTSNGNDNFNASGSDYVAYCWKVNGGTTSTNTEGSEDSTVQANDDAGFSIVKYTGTGSNLTIGHGLSAAPDLVIVKNLDSTTSWLVQHSSIGPTKALYLETTGAETDNATFWNDTAPTATTVSIGTHSDGNASGDDAIAYCFRNIDDYSKFGSYTGNGSTNGPVVNTGFEPAFLMIKTVDGTDNWAIFDNARNTSNPRNKMLQANLDAADNSEAGAVINFLSNGFQSVGTGGGGGSGQVNSNGDTYIYMAFAADPDTTTPTLADSFGIQLYTGTGGSRSVTGYGFKPNFIWMKRRNSAQEHALVNSVRGSGRSLYSDLNNAEDVSAAGITSFDADGFSVGSSGLMNNTNDTYVAWAWKADDNEPTINDNGSIDSIVSANANAGFSIVKYTHNGTAGATIGHGLSAAPQVVMIKCTSDGSTNWINYYETIGDDDYLTLNLSNAVDSYTDWISVTSTTFAIGAVFGNASTSGREYIAYCWHSATGYSKISSYSGTGSSNAITGLGFQPDYVMIKEADGADSWEVYDSERGDNKVLYPNGDNSEGTGSNFTSFDSGGFTVSSASSVNESGKEYIYAAFKIN